MVYLVNLTQLPFSLFSCFQCDMRDSGGHQSGDRKSRQDGARLGPRDRRLQARAQGTRERSLVSKLLHSEPANQWLI